MEKDVEEWRPTRWPNYEVSSHGRVRSRRRPHVAGRVLLPIPGGRDGRRAQVELYGGPGRRRIAIAHLVCEAWHGPRPDGQECRHLDDDSSNDRPENLAWGTRADNEADTRRNGGNHNRRKAACPAGHAYEGGNVIWYQNRRYCRTCQYRRNEEYRARRRAAS